MSRDCRCSRKGAKPSFVLPIIILILALAGALALSPKARGAVRSALAAVVDQGRAEFSPEIDASTTVGAALDISLDSAEARPRIADAFNTLRGDFAKQPELLVYRYANQTEWVGGGSGPEVRTAVREKYVEAATPGTPDTMLAPALEVIERDFLNRRKADPKRRLIVMVGSNGGVEDIDAAQIVAARLAKLGASCVYFGAEARLISVQDAHGTRHDNVQARIIEAYRDALRPFEDAGRLTVLTKNDFNSRHAAIIRALVPTVHP